ncbi:winged helix-turn-helix transcriptional regulator [Psychrobacillus sp. FJAT-21963]|uniref:winged helix-turn-helix transcriptional regulator n=1 Tax=Psychrobacillus sp. FJAT-21963 TaxID=1712028 RepID=UPI0009E9B726
MQCFSKQNIIFDTKRYFICFRRVHISININKIAYIEIVDEIIKSLLPVEYSLTEKGQTLWPIIQEMCQWGEHNN